MNLIKAIKTGDMPICVKEAALLEDVDPIELSASIASGVIVLPANKKRTGVKPVAIGRGLRTKINANIGTSQVYADIAAEIDKLKTAEEAGADTVMDLSTGNDINATRQAIINNTLMPLGTVPIYQAAAKAIEERGSIVEMTADDMFDAVERHCSDGVDFITVHCGVTRRAIGSLQKDRRVTDVVSRGGAFLTAWIIHNDIENPLYEHFDRLLDIAYRYDVTLSLGDGMRPGCGADASDSAQITELATLGELVKMAREANVQVMVEGPGHMPMDQIEMNMKMAKTLCHDSPFYVLGPLVTDIAPGYDEITAAIGGSLAAMYGADFLCYVTPREHLGLPTSEDVHRGVIASRIAGHAADIVKRVPGASKWDRRISEARKALDWSTQAELSIDPDRARRMHNERQVSEEDVCTMCGSFCAMKVVSEYLGTVNVDMCS